MVIVDYVLLGAFAVSVVVGFFRGFFREALSLVNWALALWLAWRFSGLLDPLLASVSSPVLKLWLGRIVLFVGALLVGGLIGHLIVLLVKKSGLTGVDRTLGALVIVFQMLEMDREPWWEESVIVPKTAELTQALREYIDAGLDWVGNAMAE